jgi:hypothetical protein
MKPNIAPHQGTVDLESNFSAAFNFAKGIPETSLQTSGGTAFTVEVKQSSGRSVIVFRQRGHEYGRVYECCWGRYYNCNRTRIGMYCAALDSAVTAWFKQQIGELKAELEKLPADRQEQLKRELEQEKER